MGRIVLVEGDEVVRRTLTRYLVRVGHRVRAYSGAREALVEPDLGFTDLLLLEWVDYAELVVSRMQDCDSPVPVLALVANPANAPKAAALRVSEVMLKPPTMAELSQTIDRLLSTPRAGPTNEEAGA
ncbi:hypothetical protein ACFL6X_02265 [Candidatus Latescibacterota bacterium]